MRLRYEFGCAVAVIHHMGKAQQQGGNGARRAGQRLLGSTLFHGWTDTALYSSKMDIEKDGWTRSRVEREFRAMAPQKPFDIDLWMSDPGGLDMKVNVRQRTLMGLVEDIVAGEPGVTVNQLAERLGRDRRTVLAMIRGDEKERFELKEGGRGRGRSHKVFMAEGDTDGDE
jgi:hypothetical protein